MNELTLLRSLAPSVPPIDVDELTKARSGLLRHIVAQSGPSARAWVGGQRRIRGLRLLPVAVATLLLGAVATAGAISYFGEWGSVDHPTTVAGINAEIQKAMADTALPSGVTYPVDAIRQRAMPAGNLTQFAGTQQVQFFAMCAWTREWLDAEAVGTSGRVHAATAMIATFPTWEAVADPRLAAQSIRDEIANVVAGAKAANPGPVRELFEAMSCATILE